MSGKNLLLLGFGIVLLIAIPLTVYLVGQQSKTKVGATASTTLSFVVPTPSPSPIAVGQPFDVQVWADPGGVNKISFVKLTIKYDPTKLSVGAGCLTVNSSAFPATLQNPTCDSSGIINVTVSAGNTDATAVAAKTKIATVTFTARATGDTILSFDYNTTPTSPTQVLSVGTNDQFNENVLIPPLPTTITIAGGASPSPSATPAGSTALPVCTNLSLDRALTGVAPYAVTFTATGNGVNGTNISKVSFTFGDSVTQDQTTGGQIGTNIVNTSIAHSYSAAGTYAAKVTLTDSKGAVSDATTAVCNKTITVTAAATGGSGGTGGNTVVTVPAATSTPSATVEPTATPATPTPIASLPATGPSNILSAGALGAVLSVLGAIIFFAL